MGDLDGSWSVSLQAAAAAVEVNGSWTEGVGLGMSRQIQLVLEILMVLMCLGAVTGKLLTFYLFIFKASTELLTCSYS